MFDMKFDLERKVSMGRVIIPASRAHWWAAGEQLSRLA